MACYLILKGQLICKKRIDYLWNKCSWWSKMILMILKVDKQSMEVIEEDNLLLEANKQCHYQLVEKQLQHLYKWDWETPACHILPAV